MRYHSEIVYRVVYDLRIEYDDSVQILSRMCCIISVQFVTLVLLSFRVDHKETPVRNGRCFFVCANLKECIGL